MGNCFSTISDVVTTIRAIIDVIQNLDINCSPEEFQTAHQSGTVNENQQELDKYAVNLFKQSNVDRSYLSKCVFICCNTYTRPSYSLGVGPMNDAITVARYMKSIGYNCFYVHNPKAQQFLDWLKFFLSNATNHLVVYYTGHGASVDDKNGDESDGKDEALVFDDKFVIDDILAEYLINYKTNNNLRVLLLNDCCHSGTIWDLNTRGMKPNILQISAAKDSQTAKQTVINSLDQGMFTFYFFKLLSSEPKLSPKELGPKEQVYLNKTQQNFTAFASTNSMLTSPIFP